MRSVRRANTRTRGHAREHARKARRARTNALHLLHPLSLRENHRQLERDRPLGACRGRAVTELRRSRCDLLHHIRHLHFAVHVGIHGLEHLLEERVLRLLLLLLDRGYLGCCRCRAVRRHGIVIWLSVVVLPSSSSCGLLIAKEDSRVVRLHRNLLALGWALHLLGRRLFLRDIRREVERLRRHAPVSHVWWGGGCAAPPVLSGPKRTTHEDFGTLLFRNRTVFNAALQKLMLGSKCENL